jgi:hypothetical protein
MQRPSPAQFPDGFADEIQTEGRLKAMPKKTHRKGAEDAKKST